MLKRLLLYHVELHLTYRGPVISVVLYLFPTTIPEPPYREMSGNKALLTFDYRPIGLWTLDARSYVEQHIISMYTFLPGMHGVTMALLMQAIHEMEQTYDRPHFARHLFRFQRILMRTTMLSAEEKQAVIEQLYPYNSLYDEDPEIQERLARKAIESKIEEAQQMVLDAVEHEYPALLPLAQQQIIQVRDIAKLRKMIRLIYKAPNEDAVRWLLTDIAGSIL